MVELLMEALRQQSRQPFAPPPPPPVLMEPLNNGDIITLIQKFNKLKPPTFPGGLESLKVEAWILEIEKLFEVFPCTEEQKVLLATFTLQEECVRDHKVTEFEHLKQGTMTVVEYEAKFTELARYEPHMYVDVLDRSIKAEVNVAALRQAKAPVIERKGKRPGSNFKKGRNNFNTPPNKRQNTGSSTSSSQGTDTSICLECGKRHKEDCRRISGACFHCGKIGHMIKDCLLVSQSTSQSRVNSTILVSALRVNSKAATEKETLKQGQVFALVLGDVQTTETVVSDIAYFDVILGMDWLAKYYATIDCSTKQVVFHLSGGPEFIFNGNSVISPPYLISSMKANKLINKGCKGFLCLVLIVPTTTKPDVSSMLVVKEFPDVFPDDLPGNLIDREIEFTIEIVPSTQPLSKTPYRMSTTELKELKT
ncbi:uncharacterized protein LOC114287614 [Camellia sinensis]|uniref:uncharacterized protein LOC114287614 n=1 Tax=Camellia sinensis TaxID=4442 RepID=UPI0010363E21|nr:uncharacterized protein LOC114287614 [Camellia sinensis]